MTKNVNFLYPDRYISRISNIDIEDDLINCGIKNILLDVDNTILTRDWSIVPDDVQEWLEKAMATGIKFCLISNDWHKNVVDVASKLNLPIVTKSIKPLPIAFLRALNKIGAKKSETIMIGDQLMTDVFGAHFVGLKCILLKPLVKCDLKHTLILRKVENKLLKDAKVEK